MSRHYRRVTEVTALGMISPWLRTRLANLRKRYRYPTVPVEDSIPHIKFSREIVKAFPLGTDDSHRALRTG